MSLVLCLSFLTKIGIHSNFNIIPVVFEEKMTEKFKEDSKERKNNQIKVVLLGDRAVGKSSIIKRFVTGGF